MALQTVEDARRVADLSRAEYASLLAHLESLPEDGLTAQSFARDWKVYQVVSHLGSQPAIHLGVLKAALRDTPPMGDEDRKAIWGYFDSLGPAEVLAPFQRNNEAYIAFVDELSEQELSQTIPWLGSKAPVAQVIANRLGEQALHSWDIRWARDRDATLTPAAVPDLIELHIAGDRLKRLARVEQAGRLADRTVQFYLDDPATSLAIRVRPDGVEAIRGRAAGPDLTVEFPAETFLRLIWGRFQSADGAEYGKVTLNRSELLPELVALYPGR